MLKLQNVGGRICPIVKCYGCGEGIVSSKKANVEMDWDLKYVVFRHKKCSRHGDKMFPLSLDLDEIIYQFLGNVDYDHKNGKRLDELGRRIFG